MLNTCCIRENADNKLYGASRRPEGAEGRAARPADRGRRLPGPEGPRRRAGAGAARRRRVRHAQPRARAGAACATRSANGPIVEILDEHEAYPSALPARREVDHAAWVTIQIGCDNSCAFCIVPSVRGKEVSRRTGDIVHEVEELARDGVRRDHAARPERQLLRPRPRRGPVPPAVRRPVAHARRGRRHRAHPLHVARIRRTCAPRRSRRWPSARRVCEHLHLPLQSGSDRTLARMHRGYTAARYLERLPRRARGDRRPRGHHRHHRRLPRRDRRRLRAHARGRRRGRVRRGVHVRVLAPARHRGGDDGRRLRRPRMSCRSACSRLVEVVERHALTQARGARRPRPRSCSSRGRRRRTPRSGRAAPARTSSCTSRPTTTTRPGELVDGPDHERGPALPARRPRGAGAGRAPAARSHPGRGGVTRHLAIVGPTASGKSAVALALAARARRRRDRVARLDAGVPGHGHRHREAVARRAGRGPAPSRRRRRPGRGLVGRATPSAARPRRSPTSRRAAAGRCSSAAPVSTCARSSTG